MSLLPANEGKASEENRVFWMGVSAGRMQTVGDRDRNSSFSEVDVEMIHNLNKFANNLLCYERGRQAGSTKRKRESYFVCF